MRRRLNDPVTEIVEIRREMKSLRAFVNSRVLANQVEAFANVATTTALTTSLLTIATATLQIPPGWPQWNMTAWGEATHAAADGNVINLIIDVFGFVSGASTIHGRATTRMQSHAIVHHAEGITATGSVDCLLRIANTTTAGGTVTRRRLYVVARKISL